MFRSLALLALLPALAVAQSPTPDLALVPGNALGFLHVRVADVWKTDAMKDVRKVFDKAGAPALGVLDTDFTPAPSTLDRITLVAMPITDPEKPVLATILAFSKPYDAAKLKAAYLSKAEEKKVAGKAYLADDRGGIAVHFADDKTLVFSDSKMLPAFLETAGKTDGPLKVAVDAAAKNQLTAAVNPKALPLKAAEVKEVAPQFAPLMAAERLTITGNVTKETELKLSLDFPNADDAAAGAKAIKAAAAVGRATLDPIRQEANRVFTGRKKGNGPRPLDELPEAVAGLAALGGLNILDEFLTDPPLTTDGGTVTVRVTVPEWANPFAALAMTSAGLALPAVQKVRNTAARQVSTNNLKQLALAMHNFESGNGVFPPASIIDGKGKRLLSWRVAVLPYIEQENLYKQFKLDEPWDSEHNKKLIDKMPKVFADPRVEAKAGETYYKVFVGNGAAFDWVKGGTIVGITDGTSNTAMIAAGGKPVVWTQPDDFEFDPKAKLLPGLFGPFEELVLAFCDGSVRTIRKTVNEDVMKAIITASGGEVYSIDD